jgi:hypothetical protein
MTDNIELRSKYIRLIEAIRIAIPPSDPDDGPVKRGSMVDRVAGQPDPVPWKTGAAALSGAVAAEMMAAVRLKVVAEKAGNAAAKDRASGRISAIIDGWCGNEPIIIVIPGWPWPWPDPDPQPEWFTNPIRRRDDLVSDMMAQIDVLQPGPVAQAAMDIALQVLAER